ncbi:related to CG16984 PROTEIN, related [Neospora caninum Liverpool]|uniref:Related to CG16984 PROTEIN, related n=1 Tax=Neospora caninum (strain Liverpool) TaxID=572307 RepID=F0V7U5_NEOCL|nr:related to CG16984 PROTEIN, related [Neospora caninum Liverpool]CBZ49786.1 related to CG16984 PROTEIN, related [Neospora caninum Liverpool]CEL64374.1 TPA: Related to CG16984 PROTEIN, related [Neospora caninum Liverpool]|eukprot:XP_003879821.1 related to CG16984 PROTEIN, related [Neospora caninum Liverpool]
MGIKSVRNHVAANAIDNILSRPKKNPEGLLDWTKKPNYGVVPEYLKGIKDSLELEYAYIESLRKDDARGGLPGMSEARVMPELERMALLSGLKKRWNSLNSEYQNTTHIVKLDTIGKAKRKEHFEEQLAAIEKYISKASKGTIVISSR